MSTPRGHLVLLAVAALGLLAVPALARGEDVLVAVAANFAEAIDELKPAFERQSGHRLRWTTGSTGKLYAQISAGAPFHVLLSADVATPERLEAEGPGVAGTRFTYAIGRLALWSRDAGRIGGDGRAALTANDVRHIAIANPDIAPYGVAARETLQALGQWESLRGRIVMGQNIGQTHSMVATGNAQLGFVALSAVISPRARVQGSWWEVPQELFSPLHQDAVLLRPGADGEAPRAFLAFLQSDDARRIIERHGYGVE